MASKWQVNQAVKQSSLPPPARLIMFALSDAADPATAVVPDDRSPSLAELSSWTGLDTSTVTRHLNVLDADGWVHRDRPDRDVARRTGVQTKYRLDVPRGAVCMTGDEVEQAEDGSPVVQTAPQRDAQDTTPRGADSTTSVVQSASGSVVHSAPVPYTDEVETIKNLSSSAKPPKAPKKPPNENVERLCNHLADRIEANGSKRPTITTKWHEAARLLLDKDGRTVEQVLRAIDWCQNDEFWRGNILSMPTLRKQYDTLRLHAQRANGRASPRNPLVEHNGLMLKPETVEQLKRSNRFDELDQQLEAKAIEGVR